MLLLCSLLIVYPGPSLRQPLGLFGLVLLHRTCSGIGWVSHHPTHSTCLHVLQHQCMVLWVDQRQWRRLHSYFRVSAVSALWNLNLLLFQGADPPSTRLCSHTTATWPCLLCAECRSVYCCFLEIDFSNKPTPLAMTKSSALLYTKTAAQMHSS